MSAVLQEKQQTKELSIDLLRVQSTPAVLVGNFIELNAWIDNKLSTNLTVITDETLKSEKKVVAELRALAREIDGKAKEVEAMVSGDILQFRDNMKALKGKVLTVADEKAEQVRHIEEKAKRQCHDLLANVLYGGWEAAKLAPEFQKATIDDLVKLTSLTATGSLTKSAIAAVEARVQQDVALKNRTQSRLMAMENQCLRADINPPLSRANVEAFLFSDDDLLYQSKLDMLVNVEIERKAEAERRMRASLEAEKQREINAALAAQQAEANRVAQELAFNDARLRHELERHAAQAELPPKQETPVTEAKQPVAEKSEEPAYPGPGLVHPEQQLDYTVNVTYRRTETFLFRTKAGTSEAKIKNYFRNKVIASGIAEEDIYGVEAVQHG